MDLDLIKYGKTLLKPHFTRNTHYCNTAVVVVGCGGTGGRIIPLLAQHIANHNKELATNARNTLYLNHKMQLVLVDSKTVLPKNLDRQNFFQFDLMKNKAQVMAERFSALYGLDITYLPEKYNTTKLHRHINNWNNAIIFDCTDNKYARQSIEDGLPASNNVIISCGNEADFGQVMYSYKKGSSQNRRWQEMIIQARLIEEQLENASMNRVSYIQDFPTILELFRDFKDTPTASCTDVILVNEQSMPINSLVAQLAYNVFYKIVSNEPMNYNMVKCNVNNVFSTNFITSPVACLKVLYKGIFGIDDIDRARKVITQMYNMCCLPGHYSSRRDEGVINRLMAVSDDNPLFCIPMLKSFLSYNYYLAPDLQGRVVERIRQEEADMKKYFGIEEPKEEEVKEDADLQPEVQDL